MCPFCEKLDHPELKVEIIHHTLIQCPKMASIALLTRDKVVLLLSEEALICYLTKASATKQLKRAMQDLMGVSFSE